MGRSCRRVKFLGGLINEAQVNSMGHPMLTGVLYYALLIYWQSDELSGSGQARDAAVFGLIFPCLRRLLHALFPEEIFLPDSKTLRS